MENHTNLVKEAYKRAFRNALHEQGLSVADLPVLLEKQAASPSAYPFAALGAVAEGVGEAIGPVLEFGGQWMPMAALGAGGLAGMTYAYAESVHQSQDEEYKRKARKADRMLLSAAKARKARKKTRERKRALRANEMAGHTGGSFRG